MTINTMQGYNLDNFEAGFREFLITQKVSSATLKNYLSDLRHFLGWYVFHLSSIRKDFNTEQKDNPYSVISLLTTDSVNAYKKYLESNKLPIKTINRRLSTLRKFCSFCIVQGWLKVNPAKNIANIPHSTVRHEGPVVHVEVGMERIDSPQDQYVFSAKHLSEFQKTLSGLSVGDAQTIKKDIEEFFVIINSTKIV